VLSFVCQRPIWATSTRTLTPKKSIKSREDLLGTGYEAAKQLGWRIFDRGGMASSLTAKAKSLGFSRDAVMTDRLHYFPYANDEFNNVLLNMLCE
jgi:hypothetical protein